MKRAVTVAALLTLAVGLQAQAVNTSGWLYGCSQHARQKDFTDGYWTGYIAATVNSMNLWESASERRLMEIPVNMNYEEICRRVSLWLRDHPDSWDDPAAVCVTNALLDIFPVQQHEKGGT